jgi:hypothetical protein
MAKNCCFPTRIIDASALRIMHSVGGTSALLKRFNNNKRNSTPLNGFVANRTTVFGHYAHPEPFGRTQDELREGSAFKLSHG